MFDLNDIWRDYDLDPKQSPSQWRNKVRRHFDETGNIKSRRASGNGGANRGTYAYGTNPKFKGC